ncbi:TATA binding protein [Diaporthe sp. PMI_573]|nr:TATA binding protein [Diaporthaceae sp. PMI_573]
MDVFSASIEAIQTSPLNANQTKNLMPSGSLFLPTDYYKLTPHGNAGPKTPEKGATAGSSLNTPITPAATPHAQQTGSSLTPTLQNIVVTINLDYRIDLKTVTLYAHNTEYNPKQFAAIIISYNIKFPICLKDLASQHYNFSSYKPKLFPSLIYHIVRPQVILLIFINRKIIITGTKVQDDIYHMFKLISPILQDFHSI